MGASLRPDRYSNYAIHSLIDKNIEAIGLGLKEGNINGVKIHIGLQNFENIHTITVYLGPKRQRDYYDYIISLRPQRVIFNPGTKNQELEDLLDENNIFYESSCTLVLLSTDQF